MNDFRVQHSNWSSRIGTTIVIMAFAALVAAPWWAERANLRLLAEIYTYVALASLWNLLAGYAGLVSVGQQAYVGLGAYILFALAMLAGVHPLVAIPLAGVAAARIKYAVYVAVAFGTAMVGALIFLQKIRISPDTAFSVNDWTAFVIFITVIGGIGRIEGPIIGTVIFFLLRQTLADLGAIYLLILGVVAIAVMLWAPKGLWVLVAERSGREVFPLQRRLVTKRRG